MSESTTILVIDDDKNYSFALVAVLQKAGFHVLVAGNGREGLEMIREQKPGLILCDMMMPPPNGIQLKKEISNDSVLGKIPFLFLTARTAQADKLAGLMSGADDYITKPVDSAELLARIHAVLRRDQLSRQRGVMEASSNTEKLYNENRELKRNAQLDPLTGAMNRRALDGVDIKLHRFIVMIDLNHFKHINDTYGRNFGDQVLIDFTQFSKRALRQDDIVIRWGSDEFLLILDGLSKVYDGYQDVENIIARIQNQCKNRYSEVDLTFSYGIAHVQDSFEVALEQADRKMYEMKFRGENTQDDTPGHQETNTPAQEEQGAQKNNNGEYNRRKLGISKYMQ